MMKNAIEIKGLTKSYSGFTLDRLDLTLPAGCIMGLIGENGAGKTTTLKMLMGITKPDGGSARVLDTDITGDMRCVKEDIGVVLDEPGLPANLTLEQVRKIMALSFENWNDARWRELTGKLALPQDKPYGDFSRGMKMKLGIAIAMSHEPKLLMLDEPTSGLDPVVRDEVVELFLDFAKEPEHSILISSHIVSDLEKLCDYIAFLHRGKLILCEEKDTLLNEYCLVRSSADGIDALEQSAVTGRRDTPYGSSAIVRRDAVPAGMEKGGMSIEELFVMMVKGAEK